MPDCSSLIEIALGESLAAPLSVRKALLVAVLLDHQIDWLYQQHAGAAPDLLMYRANLGARSSALAAMFALSTQAAHLQLQSVAVPVADYPTLGVEDFMVSLYNANTVQRIMLLIGNDPPVEFGPVLAEAVVFVRTVSG